MQRLGIALVGTGFALRVQLPALRLVPAADVRVLVGRERKRTQELAEQHGIPAATDRLDEALAEPIQLVFISTPPDLHRPQCEAALAAGKHVVCEKPLAPDAAAAREMLAAARRAAGAALVDHQMRFAPNVRKLRRLLREGYAGEVRHAHVTMLLDRWLDPRQPHAWWHERERGGGVLAALGSHAVDLLRWLFGEVVAAGGTLRTFVRERPVPGELLARRVNADEFAAVTLQHEGGAVSTILLSVVAHRGPKLRFEIYGAEGTLSLDEDNRLWGSRREAPSPGTPLEELSESDPFPAQALKSIPDSPWARAFAGFARELVTALAAGEPVPAGAARFEDGYAAQLVLDTLRSGGGELACPEKVIE
jgi:predicted dehydrogenase